MENTPPLSVPPAKFHVPSVSLSVRPPVMVPVRFTVPPVRVNRPGSFTDGVVNAPPRFTTPPVTPIVPVFDQSPEVLSEPPLPTAIVPLLAQLGPARLSAPPSAAIV